MIYLVLVALALTSFSVAVATASAVVDSLVTFMVALLPLLIPLVAATGAVVTAGLFSPLMIFATQATGMVVKEFVLPLIFCGAILELVSRVWEGVSVSSLAALLRQAGLTLLGFFFSVFLGVMAVQGAAGAIADGVTVRTAKFLSGTFIPVVGGMFADAVEVVIGSALILKNAVGLLGNWFSTFCFAPETISGSPGLSGGSCPRTAAGSSSGWGLPASDCQHVDVVPGGDCRCRFDVFDYRDGDHWGWQCSCDAALTGVVTWRPSTNGYGRLR